MRRRALLTLLLLGLVALAGAPAAVAAAAAVAAMSGAGTASDAGSPRLVVVGAPGLAWSDLEDADLSAARALVQDGALGSMTVRAVRSRSCAVDAWLTLSAGRRAADAPGPCRAALPVADGSVPHWAEYLAAAAADSYDAHPGTLGEEVTASGACVEAVGAGAAIGAADRAGRVPDAEPTVPASFRCPVVLVDAGVLPAGGGARAAALERLDALVARVVAADPEADVVLAGVGDGDSAVRPRAVVAAGPSFGRGLLTSGSTRQPGVVQLQDLTATALERVGAPTAELTGRALEVGHATGTAAALVSARMGFEERAATLRAVSPQVTGWLAVAFAAWAVVVAVLWWRRGGAAPVPGSLRAGGVAVAAVPVSTFVANLVPWWRAPAPGVVLLAVLIVVVAVLTAGALWVERRRVLGALRCVAVVTLVVLAGDVLLGSRLQLGSVFGQNPVVGGRFYGFGNTSFALYGLAVLVVVGWVAGSGRSRRWSVLGAVVVLLLALAVEALPSLGADFGGPPGLLLGGLLVIASAVRVRLTWVRVLGAVAVAGGLAVLVAVLDWLRPASARTHLGEFVESVVSGEAGAVVGRKLAQNVANLGSAPLLAVSLATVVLALVAWRRGWRPVAEGRPVLLGAVVMGVVGFLANDSGLVIPAFVALVLAPLLVAAGGTVTRTLRTPQPRAVGGARP